jgi:hypothetical protein
MLSLLLGRDLCELWSFGGGVVRAATVAAGQSLARPGIPGSMA